MWVNPYPNDLIPVDIPNGASKFDAYPSPIYLSPRLKPKLTGVEATEMEILSCQNRETKPETVLALNWDHNDTPWLYYMVLFIYIYIWYDGDP